MKLTSLLFITTVLFQIQAFNTYAQDKKISLDLKEVPLKQVLNEIERTTDFKFLYEKGVIQTDRIVSVSVKDQKISEVLNTLFANDKINITFLNKQIILKPKKEATSSKQQAPNPDSYRGQQQLLVSGKVINQSGEPLPGVTVLIKGTSRGVTTDFDGRFNIVVPSEDTVLVFSYLGLETQEVTVGNQDTINIALKEAINELDAVTINAGYYKTSRKYATGSISQIKAKDIENQPVNNPLLALQGRIPGLNIFQANGLPGSAIDINIRGKNSIANGSAPLFIIDGVVYPHTNIPGSLAGYALGFTENLSGGNPFTNINPADIASIEVLKDADATAIYGSRGANGVILITTKKGKAGKFSVDVSLQTGLGSVPKKLDLLNTQQYLAMRREAFQNDGDTPDPNVDYDLTLWDPNRETDWQEVLLGKDALYQDAQLYMFGGNENVTYRFGGGFHRETSVFPGDFHNDKGFANLNLMTKSPNQKWQVSVAASYTVGNNQLSATDLTELAVELAPNAPALYNPDGFINWAPNQNGRTTWPGGIHPIARQLQTYNAVSNNLIANANVAYKITDKLSLKSSFGYTFLTSDEQLLIPFASLDPATHMIRQRRANFFKGNYHTVLLEPQLDYNTDVFGGRLQTLFGFTFQSTATKGINIMALGFNSDLVMEDLAAATNVTASSKLAKYKYNALYGRLNYVWRDKYVLNLTMRRDGSSRFGQANRFHNFWSAGVGWIFSDELFKEKKLKWMSYGKLRTSYGTTGNDQIGNYAYLDLYEPTSLPYQGAVGLVPTSIYSPDMAWEETRKLDVGIDLGFFDQKLNVEANYYNNRSDNQLLDYPLPTTTGFTSIRKNLDATIENTGWEFQLHTVNIEKRTFKWETAFNLSFNDNKLISGSKGLSESIKQKIGHPITSFFVYKYAGVDIVTGLPQVYDRNGQVTSNPDPVLDKTELVKTTPNYFGGLQNSLTYKNFNMDFLVQFVKFPKVHIYNYNYIPGSFTTSGSNQPVTVLDRWQTPGDIATIQRFNQDLSTVNAWSLANESTLPYGDGSFIRLKNVSLTWTAPASLIDATAIKQLSLFFRGQNLFTITKYQGLDPDTRSSTTLPQLRILTFGLNITI